MLVSFTLNDLFRIRSPANAVRIAALAWPDRNSALSRMEKQLDIRYSPEPFNAELVKHDSLIRYRQTGAFVAQLHELAPDDLETVKIESAQSAFLDTLQTRRPSDTV